MKFKKIFLSMLCIFIVASPATVSAKSIFLTASVEETSPSIQPRINVTGYKYMTMNGKKYKRLWSYTYYRWEEPGWTPA